MGSRSPPGAARRGPAARPRRSAPPLPGMPGPRCSRHTPARGTPRRSRPGRRTSGARPPADPPKRSFQSGPPTPASVSSRTRMSWASRSPPAERQWRMSGLRVSNASWMCQRRLSSWTSAGDRPRSWSRPVSPMARASGAARQRPRVDRGRRADTGRADADARRPTYRRPAIGPARCPPRTSARSQPGASSRSTPASRAAASTTAASAAKASAWRWPWESTRRTTKCYGRAG